MTARETSRRSDAQWRVVRGGLRMGYLVAGQRGTVRAYPITVGMRWCDADPQVVRCTFPSAGSHVQWLIGRELLVEGCRGPVGLGDVSVLPDPFTRGMAELVLSTDSGRACLRFRIRGLTAFLDRLDPADRQVSR